MERALYTQVSNAVHEEFNAPPPQPEYVSVTKKDFTIEDFKSELPAPEREHNVETEQPVTFWSSHKDKIHVSSSSSSSNRKLHPPNLSGGTRTGGDVFMVYARFGDVLTALFSSYFFFSISIIDVD